MDTTMEDLAAVLRLRGTLDTSEDVYIYYRMKGSIFADIPGKPVEKLFNINGVNKARVFKKDEGKYILNSKEVVFYEDRDTGKTLESWKNPFTGEINEVFPVYNDPVNIPIYSVFIEPPKRMLNDSVALFSLTIPLCYPNPLPTKEFSEYSTGDYYVGSESFNFVSWTTEMYDAEKSSVPGMTLWTRTGPWLPWMKMGQNRPGRLFYSAFAWKTLPHYELPLSLREKINRVFPQFSNSPQPLTATNQTSWTSFRDIITERRKTGHKEIKSGNFTHTVETIKDSGMEELTVSDPCLEVLKNAEFSFCPTGKAFVVGSTQRRLPYKLKGEATVKTSVGKDGISVSMKYSVTVCDSRTGLPVDNSLTNCTSTAGNEASTLSDSVEGKVQFCDLQRNFYNNIQFFTFLFKNRPLSSMQEICLLFPQRDSLPLEPCLSSAVTIPAPCWIEKDLAESYLLLSMSG